MTPELAAAAIVEMSKAVQAVCHCIEVVIASQPEAERAAMAKLRVEMLEPWIKMAEWWNHQVLKIEG